MTININTVYPGQSNSASAAYPYGSARNISSPNDGTGTPLEQSWVNDIFGFIQSVLSDQNITPNGSPDSVSNPQILNGVKGLKEFSSITAARAKAGAYNGETRFVFGKGIFVWDENSTLADDGLFVLGSFTVGRWVRRFDFADRYIQGLGVSSVAMGPIVVEGGAALDSTNSVMLYIDKYGFAKTVTQGTGFVPGQSNTGVPDGVTIADGVQLHVFLLRLPNGTFDIGFDTDLAATNLKADPDCAATHYRRISSLCFHIDTEVSSSPTIMPFTHHASGRYTFIKPKLFTKTGTSGHAAWTPAELPLPRGDIEIDIVYSVPAGNVPYVLFPRQYVTRNLDVYKDNNMPTSNAFQLRYTYYGGVIGSGMHAYRIAPTGDEPIAKFILEGYFDYR